MRVLEAATPLVVLIAIALRRWEQFGPNVSGVDAGNWFAFERSLLGQGGRTAESAYPPAVPLLLALGQHFGDAFTVARLASVLTLLAVMAAVYYVTSRETSWWIGLCAAATLGSASLVTEPSAFGGYPQNLALAILVAAVYLAARYLRTGGTRPLASLAIALAAAALVHHVYFALTGLAVALLWLRWLSAGPAPAALRGRSLGLGAALAGGLLAFAPTAAALLAAGYEPPLSSAAFDFESSFRYGLREAPLLWSSVIIAATLWLAAWSRRRADLLPDVAAVLMAAALVTLLLSTNNRALPPLLVGAVIALAHAGYVGARALAPRGLQAAPLAALALLPIALWPAGDRQAAEYYEYYRTVDGSLLETAAWIDEHHGDGLVVIRADRNTWPLGWWFEGLTDARIAVGSDPRWLGFPEERAAAELASQLFDVPLTSAQVAVLAAAHDVDLLVARKWDWIGWRAWLAEPAPSVTLAYDEGGYVVIAVSRTDRAQLPD